MAATYKASLVKGDQAKSEALAVPQTAVQVEFDFVEEPAQDFFCPVTLELLINPHQTLCCGNHLSQEAASRLICDGKPCPTCKEPQFSTIPDKFFKRKVNEIKIRCPHKKSGCEWVGEVNKVKEHSDFCPKRPWQCLYCHDCESTYDIGVNEHVPKCTKYPVKCPNSCEAGSVARCDLESHLMVCPLQPVTCEYAELGCDVKVLRRDFDRHMKEGQKEHWINATLFKLQLIKENVEDKNKLLRIIEEKDQQLKRKDEIIADLQKQLKQVQDGLETKVIGLQQEIKANRRHLEQQGKHIEFTSRQLGFHKRFHDLYIKEGFSVHDFTLSHFSAYQAKRGCGNWYSDCFYTLPDEYNFCMIVCTNGEGEDEGVYMRVWFKLSVGNYNYHEVDCSVSSTAHVSLLNQLGDHTHHERTSYGQWNKNGDLVRIKQFFKLSQLGLDTEKNTQYLENDCLKFRVYFKACKK